MNLKHLTFNKIFLSEIDSTNSFLIDLSKEKILPNGSIVVTDHQTNGKGQRGSEWESEKGKNLTFSFILYPHLQANRSFFLNIISSLAVNKVLTDLKLNAKIKWPNDILINNKKICGILIENIISGTKINQSVIGIGFNINQSKFKDNINATSLKLEGFQLDKEDVIRQLYQYLDFYFDLLLQSNFDLLLNLYYKQMFKFNLLGDFIDTKNKIFFTAKVLGIDDLGRLKLKLQNNQKVKVFDLKEVKFIL